MSLSKEITFRSSKDGVMIHGTLSRPTAPSKGAVLLIAGSGKVDRDETTSADVTYSGKTEKLFVQLSDALNDVGVTTFRYDKRGVLDADGAVDESIWVKADREHLIADAIDAAKLLAAEAGESLEHLILLGHSEGTVIATEVALALGGKLQALLLFGAQARSMKDMLHFQIVESRVDRNGEVENHASAQIEYEKALELIAGSKEMFAPDGKPIEWYRQFLAAPSNAQRLKLVKGAKFVFQGEQDPQTPIAEVDMFANEGVEGLTVYRYPGLGHGFSPDKNGRPTLGPISEKVIFDLKSTMSKIELTKKQK